jgi:hypothetical protein
VSFDLFSLVVIMSRLSMLSPLFRKDQHSIHSRNEGPRRAVGEGARVPRRRRWEVRGRGGASFHTMRAELELYDYAHLTSSVVFRDVGTRSLCCGSKILSRKQPVLKRMTRWLVYSGDEETRKWNKVNRPSGGRVMDDCVTGRCRWVAMVAFCFLC